MKPNPIPYLFLYFPLTSYNQEVIFGENKYKEEEKDSKISIISRQSSGNDFFALHFNKKIIP
ncbi:hypothetical protein CEY12_00355 [Chryseobacterium sp. T16E-39]|nr:hypothetical protein CEY12_00355 [Chryseobacterium sp. T16E-39]